MSKTVKHYRSLIAQDQAATITTYFDLSTSQLFALQTEYESITGTFLIKERAGATAADATFTYKTNTDIALAAPADNVGGEVVKYADAAVDFYSITFTYTSGTGGLWVGLVHYDGA